MIRSKKITMRLSRVLGTTKTNQAIVLPYGCKLWNELRDDLQWACEPKYNGYRCIAHISIHGTTLISRHDKKILHGQRVIEELNQLKKSYVFDGELVGRGDKAMYYVFDLFAVSDITTTFMPLAERRMRLSSILLGKNFQRVILCPQWTTDKDRHYHEEKSKGNEGLVLKNINDSYSKIWFKVKS